MTMQHLRQVICHARPPRLPLLGWAARSTIRAIALLADDDGRLVLELAQLDQYADSTPAEVASAVDVLVEHGVLRRDGGVVELLPLAPGCSCDSCVHGEDCYCWEGTTWPTS